MARFGKPGERGNLDVRYLDDGSIQGFFVPKDSASAETESAQNAATVSRSSNSSLQSSN